MNGADGISFAVAHKQTQHKKIDRQISGGWLGLTGGGNIFVLWHEWRGAVEYPGEKDVNWFSKQP